MVRTVMPFFLISEGQFYKDGIGDEANNFEIARVTKDLEIDWRVESSFENMSSLLPVHLEAIDPGYLIVGSCRPRTELVSFPFMAVYNTNGQLMHQKVFDIPNGRFNLGTMDKEGKLVLMGETVIFRQEHVQSKSIPAANRA